jgi:hypothetical protein
MTMSEFDDLVRGAIEDRDRRAREFEEHLQAIRVRANALDTFRGQGLVGVGGDSPVPAK